MGQMSRENVGVYGQNGTAGAWAPPPCRYVPRHLRAAAVESLRKWKRWAAFMRRYLGALRKAWLLRERERRGDPRWWPKPDDRHPYLWFEPHTKQAEFIYAQADQQYAFTGNRGAKTWALAWKAVFGATGCPSPWFLTPTRVPYLRCLNWPRDERCLMPWIGLIISHKAKSRDEAIGKIFLSMLLPDWTGSVKRDNQGYLDQVDVVMALPGEQPAHICRVLWFAQSQTEAAIMGLSANWVVIDEELKNPRADTFLSEVLMRLGDRRGFLWYGFTPIDSAIRGGATHLVNEVLKPARLGKVDPRRVQVFQWSTHDNTHLSPGMRAHLDAECRDPQTGAPRWDYALRILGEPVGAGLSPIIHPESIEWQRRNAVRAPVAQGRLIDAAEWKLRGPHTAVPAWAPRPVALAAGGVAFEADDRGDLVVWAHPQAGHHYIIGCDTGTGSPGGNPTAAVVLDRGTGEVVALLWGLIDEARLGPALVRLGHYYQTAWLCVERASGGFAVISYLTGPAVGAPRYSRLYLHDRPGGFADVTQVPGYPAGANEQAFMLSTISAALSCLNGTDPPAIRIASERVVNELGSMARDEKGAVVYPTIREGECATHCDAGVAFGLAVVAHQSPTCPLPFEAPKRAPLPDHRTEVAYADFEALEQQERDATGAWRESTSRWCNVR